MSHRHPIDDLFHRRLAQYDAGAPAGLWDRLEARRRRQRRYRRLGWWTGSLGAAALVAGILYGQFADSPAPAIAAFPIATTPADHAQTHPAPEATVSRRPGLAEQSTTSLTGDTSPNSTDLASAAGRASTRAAAPSPTAAPVRRAATTATATPARRAAATPGTTPALTLPTPYPFDPATLERTDVATPAPAANLTPASAEAASQTPDAGLGSLTATTPEDAYDASRLSGPHLRERQSLMVATLPAVAAPPSHLAQAPVWRTAASKPIACAQFRSRQPRFMLEATAGALYANQGLQASTDEARLHLQNRLDTERNLPGHTASLRLAMVRPGGWGLRTGLDYTQLRARFEFLNPEVLEIHIMPVIGPNGEVIGADTTYSPYAHRTTNRYTLLSIPLLLGHEWGCGKWRLGLHGGALLNLSFEAAGEYLAPGNNGPSRFGQTGEAQVAAIYRTHAGLALQGSATAAYHLHGRWSVLGEAVFQQTTRSITTDNYALRQQPWWVGLRAGLRMRL